MYKSERLQTTTTTLHCTSSEAPLEVAFPMMLFATHRYSPLSLLFTSVIVKFFSDKILILELLLVSMGDPFLVHDISGAGIPSASQGKITTPPSFIDLSSG